MMSFLKPVTCNRQPETLTPVSWKQNKPVGLHYVHRSKKSYKNLRGTKSGK
jgi:hypothetical protein